MLCADWKSCHDGNCSASRGLPSDAEQLSRVTEFSEFALNNHYRFVFLHTLPSMIVFQLEYALFYQFYSEISTFSIKKYSVRLLSTTSWRHARSRLKPTRIQVRRKYSERVKIAENLIKGCNKKIRHSPFYCICHYFVFWLSSENLKYLFDVSGVTISRGVQNGNKVDTIKSVQQS